MVSVVGCAILLGQGRAGYGWHGAGHFRFITQAGYHGLFAAACSWQWLRLNSIEAQDRSIREDQTTCDGDGPLSDPGVAEPAHDMDLPAAENIDEARLESSAIPPPVGSTSAATSLSYWILGYGILGLFGFNPALSAHAWSSNLWSPVFILASLSPLMMGPILIGLDKISMALSKDDARHAIEMDELHEHHEILLEALREDDALKKNLLLETVGKEVTDAATLAIETLRQMTPDSLFPPSISHEQLSPCTLPIPITSILGLFTTMRHLQYIARNMQRLSRVMFTEYVQGIVEKNSPHYHHRGESKFDVGEFVQSLGDLVSADASLKDVEFVIYHSEYALAHSSIKGTEESWRHALINLIKSIIDCAKAGSTVELCLALFENPRPDGEKKRVMVSFEISYYPNPTSASTEDDLAKLNALLASKLVRAMGGSLEIEQLERQGKKFIVSIEVELSQTPQEEKTGNLKHLDDQQRSIHPLEPATKSEDGTRSAASQDQLQRLENMQTTHPLHGSQQFFQQHAKSPLSLSSSPPPPSPQPRRAGSGSGTGSGISAEPTIPDLVRFRRKLAGIKVTLFAREHSAFATHLIGYLKAWGITVTKETIGGIDGASGETEAGDAVVVDEPQTPGGAKRTGSSSSLNAKHDGFQGKPESPSPTTKALSPAFVMIDDDVKALRQQIIKLQSTPPPAKRPTHRRHKSVTSIQHTSIIYFTSLPTFKESRDAILSILGPQMPGLNYSIANTLTGGTLGHAPLGPLPYILVLPKPAGPRRVLTAMHTAINAPVLDQPYSPIATAPTPPAPAIRHFSDEINPLDRDQIVYDPILNQAFARTTSHSSQSSPGGVSPNGSLPREQRQRHDMMRQLIDAGGNVGAIAYPFDNSATDILSPDTPGSLQLVGLTTGVIVPGIAGQPAGIQFDPTARSTGTFFPSLPGPSTRRVSNGAGRRSSHSLSSNEGGTVVVQPSISTSNLQPFSQRSTEGSSNPPTGFIRLNGGQPLRPGAGRLPLGTQPPITQSSGLLFSPPTLRHSGISSPLPQRPEPAAMRNGSGGGGSMSNMSIDSPKSTHPVLPHGTIPSPSPLPTSTGALARTGPGTPGIGPMHAVSPPPLETAPIRPRAPPVKKGKDTKAATPSQVKSGVVERVSPLVNVLIVEDNDINQKILAKFMRKCKIRYDLACNGREAVDKWKVGGFHLVLMDIQMPVMDGIEATREIRRLEKAQRIGVFPTNKPNSVGNSMQSALSPSSASSSSPSSSVPSSTPASPFRSPVIIVALTATAESEDLRRTALLAGCNDYIIKPVQLPWLERKIVDWGCMQALIDVDAWKEWKRDQEAVSPGNPSGGAGAPSLALKKSLASTGANLKRPSLSARSIKGSKAAATKNAEATGDADKKSESTAESDQHSVSPGAESAVPGTETTPVVTSTNSISQPEPAPAPIIPATTPAPTIPATTPAPLSSSLPNDAKHLATLPMIADVNRRQNSTGTDTAPNMAPSEAPTLAKEHTVLSTKSVSTTVSPAPAEDK
ncbi:ssk1 response regulator receiver [Dissophora ornata]|nr:ssk1 response regulator receiver [Dissophora ornata]